MLLQDDVTLLDRVPGSLAPVSDLRRRARRELSDVLVERARWLPSEQRQMVRMYFGQGLSAAELGGLLGATPRATRARIRRLGRRLMSPQFEGVLHRRGDWPPTRRRVATAVVLEGRTLRNAAGHLRLTLHQVRREMAAIETLVGRAQ